MHLNKGNIRYYIKGYILNKIAHPNVDALLTITTGALYYVICCLKK